MFNCKHNCLRFKKHFMRLSQIKSWTKIFPFVLKTYGFWILARRGGACAPLPYPEGIKAKIFDLRQSLYQP
jgi:hypothetical protein